MHVQYLSVKSEKINNHYFTAVGPGNLALSILKIFWGSMPPGPPIWRQPATLPDKILDQRLSW